MIGTTGEESVQIAQIWWLAPFPPKPAAPNAFLA